MTPEFSDGFGHRENPPREPGTHIDIEPALQRVPLLADRKHVDTFADFTDSHNAEEDALLSGVPEKSRYAFIGRFAGEFGWDIRVNQISIHNSMSRPASLSRSKSRLRPRNGAKSSTKSLAG